MKGCKSESYSSSYEDATKIYAKPLLRWKLLQAAKIKEFAMNTLSFFNPRFTSDLFDVIDRNFSDLDSCTTRSFVPRVDVRATKDNYELEMELPGMTENDVTIDLKDREITIASVEDAKSSKEEKAEEKANEKNRVTYLVKERVTNHFTRSFTLPDDIDSEGVNAKFQNGLLTITIPRKAEGKARRIAICA